MPRKDEWHARIKAVEREYWAMRQATDYFLHSSLQNPTIIHSNLKRGDIVTAAENLSDTYLMRLFAEFESAARQYWKSIKKSLPKTEDLINALAARRQISPDIRTQAHAIRDHRNQLVHDRGEIANPLPIETARNHLCTFLSYLPEKW